MELFGEGKTACFAVEQGCETGIFEIGQKVAVDMERVSGLRPDIVCGLDKLHQREPEALVLFATVGKSEVLEQLEQQGVVNLSEVKGKNEVFGHFVFH